MQRVPVWGETHSNHRSVALLIAAILCVLFASPAAAQTSYSEHTGMPLNLWLTVAGVATAPLSFDKEGVGFSYESDLFDVGFDFVLNNDQKYTPSELHMRGRYFDLRDGHLSVHTHGFSLTAGRVVHRDETPGPYSLFISSADLPTTLVDFRLDTGFFFYNTRWLELNRQSELYTYSRPVLDADGEKTDEYVEVPLDRGAVYKVYGVDFGRLRVGLQESVVYLYRSFYPEYFFSPLPMYFTQLVNSTTGKPWTQIANENSMMGFFVDYQFDDALVFGQFLIDDWNEMGIDWLGVGEWNNPAKFAWYLGGEIDLGLGTLGLYQAGATKYTFEPTYQGDRSYGFTEYNAYPYSYTYFPVTEYEKDDGTLMPILPQDNYIGYLHGENNVAIMASFDSEAYGVDYRAALEYTISGPKSPANPWHEDGWHSQQGTQLLDGPREEHKLLLSTTAQRWFGPVRVQGSIELGGVWNELELRSVEEEPGASGIFTPSDEHRFLWRFGLELRWVLGVQDSAAEGEAE
ncbi:MAG: hypothetical protein ACOC1I_06010 [Spirochaetota bacterium]